LEGEQVISNPHGTSHGLVDFRKEKMSQFSLKYLAKFIFEFEIESICINGGAIPLNSIKTDNLVELNLRD